MTRFKKQASKVVFCAMAALFVATAAYAKSAEDSNVSFKLDSLQTQVKEVQKTQKEIIDNQTEILETLQQLKVWVRRN